jgi:hypothetical protein
MVAPALVKFEQKKDGLNVVLRVFDPPQAATVGTCVENLMKYFKQDCPGHRVLRDEEMTVADRKGRLIVVEWKESVDARVVVPRGLRRFYMIESGGPAKRIDDVLALLRAVAGSVKIGLPLSKAEEDALSRRPALAMRPSMAREEWARVMVQSTKIGWQRTVLREEKLDGAAAYGYESEVVLTGHDGRSTRKSRGALTPDGASQTCEFELLIEEKSARHTWRETTTLKGGDVSVVRELEGVRSEARFRVPEGTFLVEAADVARRLIAQGPKGSCAMRVLETFMDEPRLDMIDIGSPERPSGATADVVLLLVKADRARFEHQYYEVGGGLWKVVPAGKTVTSIERCTKEEATK